MKKIKITIPLIAVLIVSALIVSFVFLNPREDGSCSDTPSDNIDLIFDEDEFEAELVTLEEQNGILKIDLIAPGLDTYSLEVMLYDIEERKTISKTDIGEGSWMTGMTNDGFYVIDQLAKTLKLYGNDGKEMLSKTFTSDDAWSSACGLSNDGKQLAFTTMKDGNVYIASVESGEARLIDTGFFCNEFIGSNDEGYYLRSVDGELIFLTDTQCRSLITDKRLTKFSDSVCAGYTDYGMAVTFTDPVLIKYISVTSVDETIVGVGGNYLATCVSKDKSDQIKSYDLISGTYATVETEAPVKDLVYMEDGNFVVVAGEGNSNELYVCTTENKEAKSFKFSDTDAPIQSSERFETPAANTAYSDKLIKNVPLIHQFPEFPTGCESVSAVMALKYFGENITVTSFVEEYLPKNRSFYYADGKKYGPDPKEYFIGDPKTAASFGCMAPVIEGALKNYFGAEGRVANTTGTKLSALCSVYIDNDVPVLVWATIGMLETNPQNTWYLEDGTRFTWPGNEHCMLLVGYDEENYYFNDPYSGKCISYEKRLCADRYAELGFQSLVILPE